jgi:hypothetical protein
MRRPQFSLLHLMILLVLLSVIFGEVALVIRARAERNEAHEKLQVKLVEPTMERIITRIQRQRLRQQHANPVRSKYSAEAESVRHRDIGVSFGSLWRPAGARNPRTNHVL